MTACRRHVLERGFCPKTNGAYTCWPLSVVSGLAQASYTVQRIEAQATNRTTKATKTKKNKKNQKHQKTKKTKDLATSLPTAIFGQIFVFFVFFCFFCLVGFFVFFSEIFGNSQKWSIFDRFSNAVNSFRIVFGNRAVRRPN